MVYLFNQTFNNPGISVIKYDVTRDGVTAPTKEININGEKSPFNFDYIAGWLSENGIIGISENIASPLHRIPAFVVSF